jgi:AcrR family transcriptional regulator
MARSADEERRVELLERIVDYVMQNGLSDLSLRPLADAVDSSPRLLLYYFRSKEQLVTEVLSAAGGRQRQIFERLPRNAISYRQTVTAAWAAMSAPENAAVFRLFFEVYGLALQNPDRFPGFLQRAVDAWLDYLEPSALRDGYGKADARAIASIVLAGYRGFLLDLCTTGDRRRLDRAVSLWIDALDAVPAPKVRTRGKRR